MGLPQIPDPLRTELGLKLNWANVELEAVMDEEEDA
jgi:hypothetical protein